MKQYNLKPIERVFGWGTMSCISLGERGRGRFEAIVPVASSVVDSKFVDVIPSIKGNPKIVPSNDPGDGYITRISSEGCYTRGTYGSVYTIGDCGVKVIAKGSGAYGDAGRIGGWNDFLLYVPDGTFLRVRPSGGSDKCSRYWLHFGVNEVHKLGKEDLELFCESKELKFPYDINTPFESQLLDLVSL